MAAISAACLLLVAGVPAVSGQLPKLPSVSVPDLPSTPQLRPPAQLPQTPPLQVPSVPRVTAPKVQPPRVPSVPSVSSGRTIGGGQGNGTSNAPARGPSRSTSRSSAGRGTSTSKRSARSERRRRANRAPRTHSERRFRREVTRLWACSYAISGAQRRVLLLRAGLDGHSPTSVSGTARALKLSRRTVRRTTRSGLRGLRGANRSQGCALAVTPSQLGGEIRTMLGVATAPALTRLASLRAPGAAGSGTASPDSGAVLADRTSSDPGSADGGAAPSPAPAASTTSGDDGFPLRLLIGLILAMAAAAVLVARSRDRSGEPVAAAVAEPAPPPPPAPPVAEQEPAKTTPSTAIAQAPWDRPSAERQDDVGLPAPSGYETPVVTEPERAEPHEARRTTGMALSGIASLAVGLLLRARRRRR